MLAHPDYGVTDASLFEARDILLQRLTEVPETFYTEHPMKTSKNRKYPNIPETWGATREDSKPEPFLEAARGACKRSDRSINVKVNIL